MDRKLPQARAAITEFVNELIPRNDIFLLAFSSQPYPLQTFTMNHEAVIERLSLLSAQGQTAIYDTVIPGLLMVMHGYWRSKALLVITDGIDNASSWSKEDTLNAARQLRVPIYSIGIGNSQTQLWGVGLATTLVSTGT